MNVTTWQTLDRLDTEPLAVAAEPEVRQRRDAAAAAQAGARLGLRLFGHRRLAQAQGDASHPYSTCTPTGPWRMSEERGGLFIAAGAPGFARYQQFGRPSAVWRLRSEVDGGGGAGPGERQARRAVDPGAGADPERVGVAQGPSRSSIKISVGGKVSQPVTLNPGWQLVQVQLADALARENVLTFTFAQSGPFTTASSSAQPAGLGGGCGRSAVAR